MRVARVRGYLGMGGVVDTGSGLGYQPFLGGG